MLSAAPASTASWSSDSGNSSRTRSIIESTHRNRSICMQMFQGVFLRPKS
jgi:hypothetical protein